MPRLTIPAARHFAAGRRLTSRRRLLAGAAVAALVAVACGRDRASGRAQGGTTDTIAMSTSVANDAPRGFAIGRGAAQPARARRREATEAPPPAAPEAEAMVPDRSLAAAGAISGSGHKSAVGDAFGTAGHAAAAGSPDDQQQQFGGGAYGDRVAPDMIIRTGEAMVQVDSIDIAIQRVRQLAQRVGGVIANSSLEGGRDQVRTATLEVKVAAPRFDDLVTGLAPFGKVESVNVTAEDVGEEYVDVNARVANARRLEARLVDLLATRTGKLSDVLTVERELARVREEIERYEGRLRYLKTRSAVSTLAITVHEPAPLLAGPPSTNPIAEAFRQAWRNLVALTAGLIASLGILIPLGALGALLYLAWKRLRRIGVSARPA